MKPTPLVALLLALTPIARAADLVTNGGFEQGFQGWTVNPAPDGSWIVVFTNPGAGHSGNSFAQFLGFGAEPDRISQVLSTTSGTYNVEFWLRSFQDEFTVAWNGTTIFDITPATAPTTWTRFAAVESASGPTTLEFRGKGSFFLDDVSVTTVPGPSAAAALGAGVLLCTRRRRK